MIGLTIEGAVARVVLERPPVNAINGEWIESLTRVLWEIDTRGGVSVIHIRSGLKSFCAGADLKMMRDLLNSSGGRDAMVAEVRNIQDVFARLENSSAVSVAEIGGAALGGGLELALACDLRVAAEDASLGLPEASLGLLPGAGGTQRLPRIAGIAVARRLILGAEVIDGAEAARLGVVHWAYPGDRLASATDDLVTRIGGFPAEALAAAKRCLAAAGDPAGDGFELELGETRALHDVAETRSRVGAFLARQA